MFQSGFMKLQRLGMARRKKEIRHMRVMAGLTVLFLALTLLFQDNMKSYQMEMNFQNYGEWFLRVPEEVQELEHSYLERAGKIWTGSEIYRIGDMGQKNTVMADLSKDEYFTGLFLGTMDQQTAVMANIELYEGYMPKKDNEIALELNVLQALGCDYELGQKISFYISNEESDMERIAYGEKQELQRVTYTLCGTIESYTTQWVAGDSLPAAIVTESEYSRLVMPKKEYTFYQIKEQYLEEVDVDELADGISDKLVADRNVDSLDELGVYDNSFAYGKSFWSDNSLYEKMTMLLIAIGVSSMGYLMSSYLSKRREVYYKFRGFGATAMQIRKMAVFECVYSTLPVALLVLGLAYIGSVVLVFCVSKVVEIPFFYVFKMSTLLTITGCFLLVLLVSILVAIFMIGARQIEEMRKEISPFAIRRMERRARKRRGRIGAREILTRRRLKNPMSVWFVRLVGIFVCVVLMGCMMQIAETVKSYQLIREVYFDYSVATQREGYIIRDPKEEKRAMREEIWDMDNVFSENVIETFGKMSGIDEIAYYTKDQTHIFDWEGKAESKLYQERLNGVKEELLEWSGAFQKKSDSEYERLGCYKLYRGEYYKDFMPVWEKLKRHLNTEIVDYDKICQGKQVIVLISGNENGFLDEEALPEETTLCEGDTLKIQTNGEGIKVEVAEILSMEEVWGEDAYSGYLILGSDVLGRRIAREDGKIYGYNRADIILNAFSSGEATGAMITRQCKRNSMTYECGTEYIKKYFQEIIQSVMLYGTLGVIILVVYLFIYFCILREKQRKEQKEKKLLGQMGMSVKKMRRMEILEGVQSGIWLWAAWPLLYLLLFKGVAEGYSYGEISSMYSMFLGKEVAVPSQSRYVLYQLLDKIPLGWIFLILSGMLVGIVLIHRFVGERNWWKGDKLI